MGVATTLTADPPRQWHRYQRRTMVLLLLAAVAAIALIALGGDSVAGSGVLLIWGELILVLAIDGKGVPRLRGRIGWHPILLAALVFLTWWFPWLYVYLAVAAVDTWKRRDAAPSSAFPREREIARLEGELGIEPVSEGTCAKCGRPLQAGAEFCAYCGAPVNPPLQLYPNCGASTFADAEFCPKCGAPLKPPDPRATS